MRIRHVQSDRQNELNGWRELETRGSDADVRPWVNVQDLSVQVGLALPAVVAASAHRWRYAKCGTLGQDALWDEDLRLGICGDWLLGPRVKAAWLSGQRLAARILGGRDQTSPGAPQEETDKARPSAGVVK